MVNDKIFKVEKIETPTFDENGQENGTWKGYSVKKIEDPANVAFDCRDKKNAEDLCEFLNINVSPVSFDLHEWKSILTELENDEKELKQLKNDYDEKSNEMVVNVDFNTLYGKNNKDVRKAHIKKALKDVVERKEILELRIDANKRKMSFLKASAYAKIQTMKILNQE